MTKRSLTQIEESLRAKLAEQSSQSQTFDTIYEEGLLSKLVTKWGPEALQWFAKNKGISRDAAKEEFKKEQLRLANLSPAQRQAEKEALGGQFGTTKKDVKIQEPKLSGQGVVSEPATASKPRLSPEPQTTQDNLVQQAQQHLRDTGEQSLIIDSPRLVKILDKLFPEKLSDLSKQRIDPKIDETRLTEAKLDTENLEKFRQDPRVRVMLDLLSRAEGNTDYTTIVGQLGKGGKLKPGGVAITDFSKHPEYIGLRTKHGPSDAAGRYQILSSTFRGQVEKLAKQGIEVKDFSPESQDKVAISILNDIGALDQILKGNFKKATHLSRNQWVSLPGTDYAQGAGPKGPKWVQNNIAELKNSYGIPDYYAVGDSQAVGVASQGGELWNKSMARTGASILDPKQFKEHLANIERIPPGSVVAISGGGNDINSAKPEVIAAQLNKLIAAAKQRGLNVVHLLPTSTDDPKSQQKREELRQAMLKSQDLAPIVDLGQASKKDPMKLHLDPKAYQMVAQKVFNIIPFGTATAATDKDKPLAAVVTDKNKPLEKTTDKDKPRDQWLSDFDRRQAELSKEQKKRSDQLAADQALLDKLQAEKDRKDSKKTKPIDSKTDKKNNKSAEKKPYEPWEPDFPKPDSAKTIKPGDSSQQSITRAQPQSSVPDLTPGKVKKDSDLSQPAPSVSRATVPPKSEPPKPQPVKSEPQKREPTKDVASLLQKDQEGIKSAYKGSAGAQAIMQQNPDIIKDINRIRAGDTIKIDGQDYTIKPGDTLDKIARKMKPTVQAVSPEQGSARGFEDFRKLIDLAAGMPRPTTGDSAAAEPKVPAPSEIKKAIRDFDRQQAVDNLVKQIDTMTSVPAPKTADELAQDELWADIRAHAAGKSPEEISAAAKQAMQELEAKIAADQASAASSSTTYKEPTELPGIELKGSTEPYISPIDVQIDPEEQARRQAQKDAASDERKESINTQSRAELQDILRLAGRTK